MRFVLAVYDRENDSFETVAKCGTCFTDADLKKLPKMVNGQMISRNNPRVNSIFEADVWFKPFIVLKVLGVEVTLSPIHRYAMGSIREESGLTIRFPRFPGNCRVDKAAEDATTPRGIVEMCTRQLRKVAWRSFLRTIEYYAI